MPTLHKTFMEVGIVLIPLAHRAKEDKDAKTIERRKKGLD